MKFFQTTSVLALAASVSAHMKLDQPVPYGQGSLNNSPLDGSGADFPCKQRQGVYEVTKMNNWKVGEAQKIVFQGQATHGGGSCQFSVTTDKEPTKESQWKVLHSVIGGCPTSQAGNIGNDPNGYGATSYQVTLPKDMPNGQYTFAWTWFNKVGNREMYMNCAPITVSGGAEASAQDASGFFGQLPDMFVANLPNSTCGTVEGEDYAFPNPGDSAETGAAAKPGTSLVGGGCASMTKMGAGAGNMGTPAEPTGGQGGAPSSAAASQPAATSVVASKPAASNPGGVFAPGASSAAGEQTTLITKTADAAPIPTSAPAVAPSPPSGPTGTGIADAPSTPSASGIPCTNDGAVVCIGSNQFGLCDRGFAVPQALAAGMSCSNGSIVRRSVRRGSRPHFHRRHGSGSNLI